MGAGCFSIYFSQKPVHKVVDKMVLPSYVSVFAPKNSASNEALKTKITDKMIKMKLASSSHQASTANFVTNTERRDTKETILSLLHTAIAAKQVYPESASELEQTGTVGIKFLIFPDGHLENINVTHTSGFSSLDQAAINAVRASSPITSVHRYLTQAEIYSVDIVFQL